MPYIIIIILQEYFYIALFYFLYVIVKSKKKKTTIKLCIGDYIYNKIKSEKINYVTNTSICYVLFVIQM